MDKIKSVSSFIIRLNIFQRLRVGGVLHLLVGLIYFPTSKDGGNAFTYDSTKYIFQLGNALKNIHLYQCHKVWHGIPTNGGKN